MKEKRTRLISRLLLAAAAFGLICAVQAGEPAGNDRVLSKVTFIHYKKPHAKPPWAGGGGGGGKEDGGYYTYISKGAKWKTIEDYRLNPTGGENPDGSLDPLIIGAVSTAMNEWETPDSANLDIFGGVVVDYSASYNDGEYRGYNTVSFGSYGNSNVIAITTVWGHFNGPISQRDITEAHILFNDQCDWGDASADPALMDVQNIATHELGHCAGMGDLYQPGANEETMYGYSIEGEISKRDLYTGDITGVINLYE